MGIFFWCGGGGKNRDMKEDECGTRNGGNVRMINRGRVNWFGKSWFVPMLLNSTNNEHVSETSSSFGVHTEAYLFKLMEIAQCFQVVVINSCCYGTCHARLRAFLVF